MRVLGIDPGGSTTGLIVRRAAHYVAHDLVKRGEDFGAYLRDLLQRVDQLDFDYGADVIAVEGLNPPTPHLGMTSVGWLMDTAQVLGAVRARWPEAVVVPPNKHGKTPDLPRGGRLDAFMAEHYPAELLGPREVGGAYGGVLRHARSAWDVAGACRTVQSRFGITT